MKRNRRRQRLPLGLEPVPHIDNFEFLDGDRLLLLTDGLVETRDFQGRFFPLESATQAPRTPDLQQALAGLVIALSQHVPGRLTDDIALPLTERLRIGVDREYTHV